MNKVRIGKRRNYILRLLEQVADKNNNDNNKYCNCFICDNLAVRLSFKHWLMNNYGFRKNSLSYNLLFCKRYSRWKCWLKICVDECVFLSPTMCMFKTDKWNLYHTCAYWKYYLVNQYAWERNAFSLSVLPSLSISAFKKDQWISSLKILMNECGKALMHLLKRFF